MSERITDADLAEIARLNDVAEMPAPTFHIGGCQCGSCREMRPVVIAAEAARRELMATRAIGRLLAELSATRRERDEAYRTADQLREGVRGLDGELDAARMENAAIRLRACDAHAAVYRAMRASPEEAYAALQDDGYVHEAVHRVLDGPDGTAQAQWDAATRDHVAALGERALRAESDVDRLRAEQAADRAVVKALVETLTRVLPTCHCGALSTWDMVGPRVMLGSPLDFCDEHAGDTSDGAERGYAVPLRALQARMATWPSEADHGDRVRHRSRSL